jgi:hypothetical protein
MPWPESILVFVLALGPGLVLAIILHEAGHVLAGRCAGFQVSTWGVGVRRPWYYQRIGSTTFYLGWPMTMGLTLCLRDTLESPPGPLSFMIFGGPMASLIGLAAGVGIWLLGAQSDVLAAWIAISLLFVISSAVPFEIRSGPVRLQNEHRCSLTCWRAAGLQSKILGPHCPTCGRWPICNAP